MKKLLGIVVLGLLLSSNAYAEKDSVIKNGFKVKELVSSRFKELIVMAQKIPINRKLSINSATRKGMQSLLKDYQKKVSEKLYNLIYV